MAAKKTAQKGILCRVIWQQKQNKSEENEEHFNLFFPWPYIAAAALEKCAWLQILKKREAVLSVFRRREEAGDGVGHPD